MSRNNVFKDKINENTEQWVQLDSLSDSFAKEKVENNTTTEDQETTKNTNTQNIDEQKVKILISPPIKKNSKQIQAISQMKMSFYKFKILNSNQTGNIDLST